MVTIDIIMPCYYASDVIRPAFERIANQTIIDQITLIMVNDCSPFTDCEYQDLREEYKNRIKIRYFKTEKNLGPGGARQVGINNATSDFIWFQDDDDEIYANNSLEQLISHIPNDFSKIGAVNGTFTCIVTFDLKKNWTREARSYFVLGSLLNREMAQKFNLTFEQLISYKEEDCAFATLCDIITKVYQYQQININIPVYCRKAQLNHESVTAIFTPIVDMYNIIMSNLFQLSYALKYKNKLDHMMVQTIIDTTQVIIPNALVQLIERLLQYEKYLTQEQYDALVKYLNLYLQTISPHPNLTQPPEYVYDIFYNCPYNINLVNTFHEKYQIYLKILQNYLVK